MVVLRGNRVEEFDFEVCAPQTASRQYLSRQGHARRAVAAGGVRRLRRQPPRLPRLFAKSIRTTIRFPVADRQALIDEEARAHATRRTSATVAREPPVRARRARKPTAVRRRRLRTKPCPSATLPRATDRPERADRERVRPWRRHSRERTGRDSVEKTTMPDAALPVRRRRERCGRASGRASPQRPSATSTDRDSPRRTCMSRHEPGPDRRERPIGPSTRRRYAPTPAAGEAGGDARHRRRPTTKPRPMATDADERRRTIGIGRRRRRDGGGADARRAIAASTRSRKSSSAGRSCWCRWSRKSAAPRARR